MLLESGVILNSISIPLVLRGSYGAINIRVMFFSVGQTTIDRTVYLLRAGPSHERQTESAAFGNTSLRSANRPSLAYSVQDCASNSCVNPKHTHVVNPKHTHVRRQKQPRTPTCSRAGSTTKSACQFKIRSTMGEGAYLDSDSAGNFL